MGDRYITNEKLSELISLGRAPLILDVRKPQAFGESEWILPGATWRDPTAVENWSGDMPLDKPVVVYCVHGHEVSQGVAEALRSLGLDVRYLRDGIEGWIEAGYRLDARRRSGS